MNFKKYRDWLIVVLALAVPFWFLRASMKDPKQAGGPDRILIQIAAPIQQASATLARGLSDLWGEYVYLVDVKQDNASLASQNARLKERIGELETEEQENRRLRRLLDLKNEIEDDVVTAQVIGKNTNEFFRIMRVTLDRPNTNIGINMPVLSPDGVVGTTSSVAGDTVDVKLIADTGSGVDVVVQRTGARGYVRGTGDEREYTCRVEFVKRTDEVDVGDVLVTSGMGLRFPKDRKVCTVSKVTKRDFGVFQQVTCTPTVDFSRLQEVLVVLGKRQEIPPPPDPKKTAKQP
ncbi:MAG: rod shape-determining protein MreC [Polyangiaceae bacterium]|nr:rod shape-determining protein MreC [Polyangiaceae bacterium]